MATKPELNLEQAYTKIKVSRYNENFSVLLNYIEEVSDELMLKVNTINSQLDSMVLSNLQSIYPIGSLYIGVTDTCPIANLFGTWEKVSAGRVLQGVSGSQIAGNTVEAGLPNITGTIDSLVVNEDVTATASGALTVTNQTDTKGWGWEGDGSNHRYKVGLNASKSSAIYGKSSTVQPPAYLVNIWKRTA